MEIRVATFNVAWAGNDSKREDNKPSLRPLDVPSLAKSIELLGADILSFQEIVDVGVLEAALALLPGAPMVIHDEAGDALASARPSMGPQVGSLQRVVVAWRPDRVKLLEWTRLSGPFTRKPVAARFSCAGREFVLCAAHLKSPDVLDGDVGYAADKRKAECAALREWLSATAPATLAEGAGATVVVAGDLNGTLDGHSGDDGAPARFGDGDPALVGLRDSLAGWRWDRPGDADGDFAWSTVRDFAIIDHIFATEGLARADAKPIVHPLALRVAGYERVVSDHRPVTLDLTL